MRIMLDTNVLISMILFPSKSFNLMFDFITMQHTFVLSSYVAEELTYVAERKFPSKKDAIDRFLTNASYEFVYTPHKMTGGLFEIRDLNDYPILYTAIIEDVDIFITGDKDFQNLNIEKPKILTPTQFMEKYLTL